MAFTFSLSLESFYQLKGRIGRLNFLIGLLVIQVPVLLFFYGSLAMVPQPIESYHFHLIRWFATFIDTAMLYPLVVKRFHDLNTPGYWALFFFTLPLGSWDLAIIIEHHFETTFDPVNPSFFMSLLIAAMMLLALLFRKGNPAENRWGPPRQSS